MQIVLIIAGLFSLATSTRQSAYAKVRHGIQLSNLVSDKTNLGIRKVQAQVQRINTALNRLRQHTHAKLPTDLGTSMYGGIPPLAFHPNTENMPANGIGLVSPVAGQFMAPYVGQFVAPSYFPASISTSMLGGHPQGAGQIPQASYPGQFNSSFGGMPIWNPNQGILGAHPLSSPNVERPLYFSTINAPTYWTQSAPNNPIGSGMPSLIETESRTKDDAGQAYWLPPASGDESAGGGGGGAAPASPGTSQYSVSPQAFYQGGAGGAGGAAPASLIETKLLTKDFPKGVSFAPSTNQNSQFKIQMKEPIAPQQQVQTQDQQLLTNNLMSSTSSSVGSNNRFLSSQMPSQMPSQMSSSMSDPSNAFDKMHQSWIPDQPRQAIGTITAANSASFDGLTGAGFMALGDFAQKPNTQLRRL